MNQIGIVESKAFFYHRLPRKMVGSLLYPLNSMENLIPEVFNSEKAKYAGREFLMNETVPVLNCKWNDVIHLLPLEPNKICCALRETGFQPENEQFYKIPVDLINEKMTVVFKYENEDGYMTPDQVVPFDTRSFEFLKDVPDGTRKWYQACYSNNRQPLLFHLVPHILTMQPIDISDCQIISWFD